MEKIILPSGSRTVPCPYCGVNNDGHVGTCELSLMKTGQYWAIMAIPVEPLSIDLGQPPLEGT